MDAIVLKLPNGETLALSKHDARVLVGRLWAIATKPGASPMAVKLAEATTALALYGHVVEVSEREYGALRIVLVEPPPSPG